MADFDDEDSSRPEEATALERALLALGYYQALGVDDMQVQTYVKTYGHDYLSTSFVSLVGAMLRMVAGPECNGDEAVERVRQTILRWM